MIHSAAEGINTVLATVALTLGFGALVAGSPYEDIPEQDLPPVVASLMPADDARIDAVTVARWIRDRKPGLRLVDLRPAEDFEHFHIPTASNIPLEELGSHGISDQGMTVLYGADEEQTMRGVFILKALGAGSVYYLGDGVGLWLTQIINPTLYQQPTFEEQLQFEVQLEIAAYFGGLARTNVPRSEGYGESAEQGLERTMRRGCAF